MNITELSKDQEVLFERILIIGLPSEEITKYLTQKSPFDLDGKIRILEQYKSSELKESPNENYLDNIALVIMIFNLIVLFTGWSEAYRKLQ
jgi:hypothetical protein